MKGGCGFLSSCRLVCNQLFNPGTAKTLFLYWHNFFLVKKCVVVSEERMSLFKIFLYSDYPENEEIKNLLQEQLNSLSK